MASHPGIVANPSAMDPPLPPCLAPMLVPTNILSEDDRETLFGAQIRYRDAKTGMDDCVTSRLRGKYYIVTYGEGLEEEVSEGEMREILKNRVQ